MSENAEVCLEIPGETRAAEILRECVDIAGRMEVFGVKRVGRSLAARALTVEWARCTYRVSQDEFLEILKRAERSVDKHARDGKY